MTSKILIGAAALLLALNLSAAVERHALVIGNANYSSSPLRNPLNDARDMAAALKGLGFQVQSLLDADAGQMEQAIIDFSNRLNEGGVGLFYYAGHGVQARGRNYLIPLQANISSEIQLKHKTIDVGMVLDAMEYANNGVNIVILDACRDNPYGDSFRTNARGLARMESPTGSLIAYATAPGDVAADGDGRNGLFTKHLLQAMQQPGRLVELTFKDVVKGVSRESGGRQTPFITASIADDFYFKPASAPPPPEPQPAPTIQSTSATIDGLSLADWLLVYGSNPITIASLDKVVAYERQHGGNAASRSYINKGIKVALANVNSADDLLEYQSKFGYLPGAPAQIEARLAELLEAGASRQDLIRLRGQFPSSATLRLQLAGAYHQAKLFDAAAGEYQSWLGLTDSSHPERKQVLEALVAAREGRLLYKAGDIIQDCPECPQMVYIPTGSFRMGDIQGGGDSDEKPVHRVSVSAFLLAQTEITVGQFRTFVKASGYKTEAEQGDGCSFTKTAVGMSALMPTGVTLASSKVLMSQWCASAGTMRSVTSNGSAKKLANNTACPLKPNGNTPRALVVKLSISLAIRQAIYVVTLMEPLLKPTFRGATRIAAMATNALRQRHLLPLTLLASTICTVTFGSGRRIAGTTAIRALPATARLGFLAIALGVFCAAALGTAIRTTSALLAAAGAPPITAPSITVSASPELSIKSCIFTSLNLVGAWGLCPQRKFFLPGGATVSVAV